MFEKRYWNTQWKMTGKMLVLENSSSIRFLSSYLLPQGGPLECWGMIRTSVSSVGIGCSKGPVPAFLPKFNFANLMGRSRDGLLASRLKVQPKRQIGRLTKRSRGENKRKRGNEVKYDKKRTKGSNISPIRKIFRTVCFNIESANFKARIHA